MTKFVYAWISQIVYSLAICAVFFLLPLLFWTPLAAIVGALWSISVSVVLQMIGRKPAKS